MDFAYFFLNLATNNKTKASNAPAASNKYLTPEDRGLNRSCDEGAVVPPWLAEGETGAAATFGKTEDAKTSAAEISGFGWAAEGALFWIVGLDGGLAVCGIFFRLLWLNAAAKSVIVESCGLEAAII